MPGTARHVLYACRSQLVYCNYEKNFLNECSLCFQFVLLTVGLSAVDWKLRFRVGIDKRVFHVLQFK